MEKLDADILKIHGIIDTDTESSSGKSDFDDDYYKLKPPPIKNIGNRQIVKISELNDRLKASNCNDGGGWSTLSTTNKLLGTDVLSNSTPSESNVTKPKKKRSKKKKKGLRATKNDNKNLPTCLNKSDVTIINDTVTMGVSTKLLSNYKIEAKPFSKQEVVEVLHKNVAGSLDIVDMPVLTKSSNKIEAKPFCKQEVCVSHKTDVVRRVNKADITEKSNKSKVARSIDALVDLRVLSKSSTKIKTTSFSKPEVMDVSHKINGGRRNNVVDMGIKSLKKTKAKSFNKPEILEVPYNNREVLNGEAKESIVSNRFNRVLDVHKNDKLKQNYLIDKKGLGGRVSTTNKPTQSIACSSREKQLCSLTDMDVPYWQNAHNLAACNLSLQTCERAVVNLSYEEISNQDLSYIQENTYRRKTQTIVAKKNLSHNNRIEHITIHDANERRLVEFVGIDTTYNDSIIYLYNDEETENSIQCVRHNFNDDVPDESICSGVFYALLFSAIHTVLLECFYSIL